MLDKLLRSRLRAKVLGWLFTNHDQRYYVRELTKLLEEDSTNISRELARLEEMGILLCQKEGKQKYYQANPQCAIFEELRGLALKTTGLVGVLREALSHFNEQIALAFVFGSQAKGTATWQSDVDLLIVGDVEETALHSAVSAVEERIHRSINYTLLSRKEFHKRRGKTGSFLTQILAGPKIMVVGSNDDL